MAKYNLGGGISGEANKVVYREKMKFEDGKAYNFSALDRNYVNFLSCVKTVSVKGARVPKSELTFVLVPKLFLSFDKKTNRWSASDTKKK